MANPGGRAFKGANLYRSIAGIVGSIPAEFGGRNGLHGTGTLEDALRQDAGEQLW